MTDTGYQPDGSYTPCPECRYEPPVHKGAGKPVGQWGALHDGDCPTFPHLSSEARKRLHEQLSEIARCQARARVKAWNYPLA